MESTEDIIYNLMLRADYKAIKNLCEVDKTNNEICNKICKSKHFWEEKFKSEFLDAALIDYDPDVLYPYLLYYKYVSDNATISKNILRINDIEKNRKYNKTNGIFKVLIDSDELFKKVMNHIFIERASIFNISLEKQLEIKKFNNIEYVDFELKINKNYYVSLINVSHEHIFVGMFTKNQVELMLPVLYNIGEICHDEFGFHFVYNEYTMEEYNRDICRFNNSNILPIRRGMWEILI